MSTMADFAGFSGVDLMQIERERQVCDLGYDDNNDDKYGDDGDLVHAAICYALCTCLNTLRGCDSLSRRIWPWMPDIRPECGVLLPEEKINRLVAAGALIGAEIDRLLREHARQGGAA